MEKATHDNTTPSEDPEVYRLARSVFHPHARAQALLGRRLDRSSGTEVATLVKGMRANAARLAELVAATPDGQRDAQGQYIVDSPLEALGLSLARDVVGPFFINPGLEDAP